MTATAERPVVSAAQYTVLQTPVVPPTSQELFDFQVWTLKEKGLDLPAKDVDDLNALVGTFVKGTPQQFDVIPLRPDPFDLDGLMALIKVGGRTGKNYLDCQQLTDVVDTPTTAHLLLDVEDGRGRLNTKPSVSFENIKAADRIAYSTWYGLVHSIVFPCVLQDHYLDLVGSRYRSAGVPSLYLRDDSFPRLNFYRCDIANPRWGAPSAGGVVGA